VDVMARKDTRNYGKNHPRLRYAVGGLITLRDQDTENEMDRLNVQRGKEFLENELERSRENMIVDDPETQRGGYPAEEEEGA
jgi:hypothetical protein